MKNKLYKLVLLQRGVSKSGNPYCRATFRYKREDGSSVSADFWLSPEVNERLIKDGIGEDDVCSLDVDLDENMRPVITDVFKEAEA